MKINQINTQNNYFSYVSKHALVLLLALSCGYSSAAVNNSVNVANFTKVPALLSTSTTPKVMLAMSNDHQLYFKLYTDWDDLDDDGAQDTTYKSSIDYYGYFDSYKCYDYSSGDGRFEPDSLTDDDKYCNGSTFSGNFLNWASMTRIDAIRKVLYGGHRVVDSTSETVLERSFIPADAHSFAKYYAGSDINQLTPWNVAEITLCSTTYNDDSGSDGQSENVDEPPLLRIVSGDFRYWAANERRQCTWDNESGDDRSGTNTTGSATSDPNKSSDGLGNDDYIVRVQVCDTSLALGTENCKIYNDNGTRRYKPIGLLQTYGETGAVDFGLITGSYEKNKSGGVVRKDIESFTSEINTITGQFTGADGIISTLNKLRISRYGYANSDSNRYNVPDSCPWGRAGFSEGNCSNWGNPFSEIYLEAVRYFAGLNKNSNFDVDDTC